jgi:vitamin B12/bleomycin/antimicrobial peptide transport system ATP-binding/permease protein
VADADLSAAGGHEPLRRFWRSARGFWHGRTGTIAWGLIAMLIVCTVLQLLVQYRLNLWNRDFFNALEFRNGREIWRQTYLLFVFVALSVALGVSAVWGRMTFQRLWRDWVTRNLIEAWLGEDRYRRLDLWNGEHQNAEYRIAEDARLATDAPIDLVIGLLASALSAVTFVAVLWNVGGSLEIRPFGWSLTIPGYLVVSVVVYAAATTGAMMLVGRHMVDVIEQKNQAESELKYAVAHLRESAAVPSAQAGLGATAAAVGTALSDVIDQWRRLCGQHMRTTLVSHGNSLLAPLVGLILCVPHYVQGSMMLGEVTQAAAAFFAVQGAFNWLVDNYPRLAEWLSSANRVGTLLAAFDRLTSREAATAAGAATKDAAV